MHFQSKKKKILNRHNPDSETHPRKTSHTLPVTRKGYPDLDPHHLLVRAFQFLMNGIQQYVLLGLLFDLTSLGDPFILLRD